MSLYVIKVVISALTIVGVTEITKRAGSFWGGILASLPLTSLLAFVWLYRDTRNPEAIVALSWSIFWMILPSLTLFIALAVLLKRGVGFPIALGTGLLIMFVAYLLTAALVRRFGVQM